MSDINYSGNFVLRFILCQNWAWWYEKLFKPALGRIGGWTSQPAEGGWLDEQTGRPQVEGNFIAWVCGDTENPDHWEVVRDLLRLLRLYQYLEQQQTIFLDWHCPKGYQWRCVRPGGWVEVMTELDEVLGDGVVEYFSPKAKWLERQAEKDAAERRSLMGLPD